ncbi:MAG: 2Fe-2S iron-sulfur cluster-binding protein [Alphaproteobacteria bacterium]|nr:2Fe-2S iron-sulfur cluster-binding protein [Alphaproteobacteria bacterium]
MAQIFFVQPDGTRIRVEAVDGLTVMESAIRHRIPGIDAECGGACSCATCHIYVGEEWADKTGGPSDMEEYMLDFAFDVRETSRLSCQMNVCNEWDGLVVHVPVRQC